MLTFLSTGLSWYMFLVSTVRVHIVQHGHGTISIGDTTGSSDTSCFMVFIYTGSSDTTTRERERDEYYEQSTPISDE